MKHHRYQYLPLAVLWLAGSVHASQWQPLSSEKLVNMPVAHINKAVEHDFQASALAASLSSLDQQVLKAVDQMQSLKAQINDADEQTRIELQYQALQTKSAYLDLMQEKQQLSSQALTKRRALYEQVLTADQRAAQRSNQPDHQALESARTAAKQRMKAATERVDQALQQMGGSKSTGHSKDYQRNVAKLASLREAINQHSANAAPMVEGESLSRRDFIRHLISELSAEQTLLDQEKLMLGYMAKLVALDAQTLEHRLIVAAGEQAGMNNGQGPQETGLAVAADLFID